MEIQREGLFFIGGVPLTISEIGDKYNVIIEGDAVKVKKGNEEIVAEEISIIGEEEKVEEAWKEISRLPGCYTKKELSFYSKKELEEKYLPVFNLIIEGMKRD